LTEAAITHSPEELPTADLNNRLNYITNFLSLQ
jgi:hypothetical protein